MRYLIAALALASASAGACPPTNGNPLAVAQRQVEWERRFAAFRLHAQQAAGIVYGVMEESSDFDARRADYVRGVLRVVHVYRGMFRRGQRIRMRAGTFPLGECAGMLPPALPPRGAYGVVILDWVRPGERVPHNAFLPPRIVDRLISEGVIRSARSNGEPALRDSALN
jgi:hypothetical protein